MIRLSEGDSTNMQYYGLLGLMPLGTTTYSSLSTGDDLILHENQGGDITYYELFDAQRSIRAWNCDPSGYH